MPKLDKVPLSQIDEPQLPVRIAMDSQKMEELKQSIRDIGLLQPIGLKRAGKRFEIEFGHRRFLAVRDLRWPTIPALIFSRDELMSGAAMIAENVEREDITPAEEAILFAQAQEQYNLDEAGLIKRFRRTPAYIAKRLALLRGDPEVFKACQEREIGFMVAQALNTCPDEGHRRYLLDSAKRSGAGADVVRSWILQWKMSGSISVDTGAPALAPPVPIEPQQHGIECRLCGGYRDPYNLVSIYIHKWELDEILKAYSQPIGERDQPTPATPQSEGK